MTVDEKYIDEAVSSTGSRSTYNIHMNVKLSQDQAEAVWASGMTESQCIREAVQAWIDRRE